MLAAQLQDVSTFHKTYPIWISIRGLAIVYNAIIWV